MKNTLYVHKNKTVPSVPSECPMLKNTLGTTQTTVRALEDEVKTKLSQVSHANRHIYIVKIFYLQNIFTALICSFAWDTWDRRNKRVFSPP